MFRRMTFALGLFLSFAPAAFAQAPDEPPPGPAAAPQPSYLDRIGLAPFLPYPDARAGRDPHFWMTADYLFAFVRGSNLPALATTSDPGTPRSIAGVVGATGSSTLFGSSWVNDELRAGLRLGFGWWCNPEHTFGVDTGFMILESRSATFSRNANDGTILARPYFDAKTGLPQAVLVAYPGASTGSLDIRASSANFYGAHIDLAEKSLDFGWYRLTSLLGYRYYRYDEGVRVQQVINPTDPNFVPGTQIATNDNFRTSNEFHGLDLGLRSQFFWNTVTVDVLTKLAVGRVFRTYEIAGDQTISVPGATPLAQQGGVLALASNGGTFTNRDWKVMPEAGVTLSWQARPYLNLRAGYSFILLNGVARAADQIDTTLNPNLFPGNSLTGVARPAANHIRSDMWIQSLNFGVEFTY